MNREILFRGKGVETNEWVYGAYILEKYSNTPYICCFEYGTFVTIKQVEVVPETVGEFTGLTDKNGKKIFEGDIVNYGDCPASDYYRETIVVNCGAIEFSDGAFYVTERQTVEMNDLIYYGTMDCEVVGNKFDNPEFLSKE